MAITLRDPRRHTSPIPNMHNLCAHFRQFHRRQESSVVTVSQGIANVVLPICQARTNRTVLTRSELFSNAGNVKADQVYLDADDCQLPEEHKSIAAFEYYIPSLETLLYGNEAGVREIEDATKYLFPDNQSVFLSE
jgi:hypothetical protein